MSVWTRSYPWNALIIDGPSLLKVNFANGGGAEDLVRVPSSIWELTDAVYSSSSHKNRENEEGSAAVRLSFQRVGSDKG